MQANWVVPRCGAAQKMGGWDDRISSHRCCYEIVNVGRMDPSSRKAFGSLLFDQGWLVGPLGARSQSVWTASSWCWLGFKQRKLVMAISKQIFPLVFQNVLTNSILPKIRSQGNIRKKVLPWTEKLPTKTNLHPMESNRIRAKSLRLHNWQRLPQPTSWPWRSKARQFGKD